MTADPAPPDVVERLERLERQVALILAELARRKAAGEWPFESSEAQR